MSKEFIFTRDLVIENILEFKTQLEGVITHKEISLLDISNVEKIDIAGLQLLISFIKEAAKSSIDYNFIGELKENFKYSLNHITFSSRLLSNGEDLTKFIKEMI